MSSTFVLLLLTAMILHLTSAAHRYDNNKCYQCKSGDKDQCYKEHVNERLAQLREELSSHYVWKKPTLTAIAGQGREIMAVTSFGNDMFVKRVGSGSVEVYNISRGDDGSKVANLKPYRRLAVPRLQRSFGLATSADGDYLFVADYNNKFVHRVPLTTSARVTNWSTAPYYPMGLSINSAGDVVVAYRYDRIQEFTQGGRLLHDMLLQGAKHPRFIAQLSNGNYVISYLKTAKSTNVSVSEFGSNGKALRTFESECRPAGLAVDKNDIVLVAEVKCNRILALNPSLTATQVMPLLVRGGLRGPYSVHLDKEDTRLCVGEYAGRRALVFDRVNIPKCGLQ